MTAATVQERALQSLGTSAEAIYRMAARELSREPGGLLIDAGCGTGNLYARVSGFFRRYVGIDVVRHEGFPAEAEFHPLDIDSGRLPFPDNTADAVAAIEVIEHLENPRAFVRELARMARPGGRILISTPNQGSALSLATLLCKGQHNAFQAADYPAHITALLEIDLIRIAGECGLMPEGIRYSRSSRIPGTSRHWPRGIAGIAPRLLSDNLMLVARKV